MLLQAIIGGFALGVTGSLHCIGMCGPLSLALPMHHLSKAGKFFSLLIYQFGRIITYSLLGALVGLAGRGFWRTGYQQWFSIGLGILVLSLAVLYFFFQRRINLPIIDRWYRFIQTIIIRILEQRTNPFGFLLLGMANGLLPCGMVYVATAAAVTFTEMTSSIGFMAAFGAGTLPAMMLVGLGGGMLSLSARKLFRKSVPVFIAATGLLLILRGMNLGIPFISPTNLFTTGTAVGCHP